MSTKKLTALLLGALIILAAAAGCAQTGDAAQSPSASQSGSAAQTGSAAQSPSAQQSGSATQAGSAAQADSATQTGSAAQSPSAQQADSATQYDMNATYIFTDSAGREVELPRNIERVAPSGSTAQIVLFTLCPDKLVGLATPFSEDQFGYIDEKYSLLPVFGNLYADTLNLESIMVAKPQVIIDIGEIKPNIEDDMKSIEERTGIPAVFIHMELDSMHEAYDALGIVTGETEQARNIIDYIDNTLAETKRITDAIPESERKSVYYGSDDGLTAMVRGTVHTDVIDITGGLNVADVGESLRGGASIVSMEQLILWNPDVIIFAPESIYDSVAGVAEWQGLNAVKTGSYYKIPFGIYNWMGRPPSVNRIIGIKWLANLLYPDYFKYDIMSEAKEFYKLFYHCVLTDAQAELLLAGSR